MRLYVFSNMYLSPIQHGIQGLHAMGEMVLKYPAASRGGKRFRKWLGEHKTVIVLNAGYSSVLGDIHQILGEISKDDPGVAFASFREEGLEDALTSVAVVVEEKSYCPVAGGESEAQIVELLEQFDGNGLDAARFGRNFPAYARLGALCKSFRLA